LPYFYRKKSLVLRENVPREAKSGEKRGKDEKTGRAVLVMHAFDYFDKLEGA
jgi:hypothetical protein